MSKNGNFSSQLINGPADFCRMFVLRHCLTSVRSGLFSSSSVRSLACSSPPNQPAPNEQKLIDQLRLKFPNATDIAVMDVSGGCGAMFEVFVEAPDFKGVSRVKQHQMVNRALKSEIAEMHGVRVSTAVSES